MAEFKHKTKVYSIVGKELTVLNSYTNKKCQKAWYVKDSINIIHKLRKNKWEKING